MNKIFIHDKIVQGVNLRNVKLWSQNNTLIMET